MTGISVEIIAENLRRLVAIDEREKGRGGAKLARLTGWSPARCVRVLKGRDSRLTAQDLWDLAQVFGISVSDLIRPSPHRLTSERAPEMRRARELKRKDTGDLEEWEAAQCLAFGRELARAFWNSNDPKSWSVLLDAEFSLRETHTFWTGRHLLFAARAALADLAEVVESRYPLRDRFPLKELMEPTAMIHMSTGR